MFISSGVHFPINFCVKLGGNFFLEKQVNTPCAQSEKNTCVNVLLIVANTLQTLFQALENNLSDTLGSMKPLFEERGLETAKPAVIQDRYSRSGALFELTIRKV